MAALAKLALIWLDSQYQTLHLSPLFLQAWRLAVDVLAEAGQRIGGISLLQNIARTTAVQRPERGSYSYVIGNKTRPRALAMAQLGLHQQSLVKAERSGETRFHAITVRDGKAWRASLLNTYPRYRHLREVLQCATEVELCLVTVPKRVGI